MSDTPRTDAAEKAWKDEYDNCRECGDPAVLVVVDSDVARAMEREIAQLRARLEFAEDEARIQRTQVEQHKEVIEILNARLEKAEETIAQEIAARNQAWSAMVKAEDEVKELKLENARLVDRRKIQAEALRWAAYWLPVLNGDYTDCKWLNEKAYAIERGEVEI